MSVGALHSFISIPLPILFAIVLYKNITMYSIFLDSVMFMNELCKYSLNRVTIVSTFVGLNVRAICGILLLIGNVV